MKKLIAGITIPAVFAIAIGADVVARTEPAPLCFSQPATHVFLPDGDDRDFEGAIETSPSDESGTEYFRGSVERDVMVAIQKTESGGHIMAPYGQSDDRNLSGDIACGSPGQDAFYSSSNVNELDRIDARNNASSGDNVYGHGGSLVALMGPADDVRDVPGSGNKIWPGRVPRTGTVRVIGGPGTDHLFEGNHAKGTRYIFRGGPGWDHLHPCIDGETYQGDHVFTPEEYEALTGVVVKNVEYIGSENHLGADSPFDACRGSA